MTTKIALTPTAELINVTPKMAAEWLEQNLNNRSLRPKQVNKWVRDMEAGRWTYSNDGICFAPDGTLINGQHRLTAVVESSQTVPLLVLWNMPLESRLSMDNPTVRKAADALGYASEKNRNTSMLAAVTRLVILLNDGRMYGDNQAQGVSHTEIVEFVEEHPILRHATEVVSHVKAHIDCPPSALGAAYWLIEQEVGNTLAEYYFDQLASRENEPAGSAILAIDSRLRQIRRGKEKWYQRDYILLLLKGWNVYAADKRVTTLSMSSRGNFKLPKVAPWTRTDVGETKRLAS